MCEFVIAKYKKRDFQGLNNYTDTLREVIIGEIIVFPSFPSLLQSSSVVKELVPIHF